MILHLTQWILDTLRFYGGWSVFMGVLIEQVIIPIPSPAIIMGAGLVLIPAHMAWLPATGLVLSKIVFPGTIASILGAWGGYYLGKWGGRIFVDKFHNYLGFTWADVERMGHKINLSGMPATIFCMRALPVVPLSLVSIVGGVLELPMWKFLFWSLLGTIPRCYLLGVLGWKLGASAMDWARGVNRFESLISGLIVLGVCAGIVYVRRRVRREALAGEGGKAAPGPV